MRLVRTSYTWTDDAHWHKGQKRNPAAPPTVLIINDRRSKAQYYKPHKLFSPSTVWGLIIHGTSSAHSPCWALPLMISLDVVPANWCKVHVRSHMILFINSGIDIHKQLRIKLWSTWKTWRIEIRKAATCKCATSTSLQNLITRTNVLDVDSTLVTLHDVRARIC